MEETARQIILTCQPGATDGSLAAVQAVQYHALDGVEGQLAGEAVQRKADEKRARQNEAFAASREHPRSQERLARLIHEHTAAIDALERWISMHEAIRRIRRVLALKELTVIQAIGILAETAERGD